MADSDNTLKILIQLGVIGVNDAKAVKDLLGETSDAAGKMTEHMPENLAAWEKYNKGIHGGGEAAEGFNIKGREMRKLLGELNQIVPGSAEAIKGFEEALRGGGGELAVVMLAIEAAKTYWDLYTESARAAAEQTKVSFDKIRETTAEARKEIEDFNKELEKAKRPQDPEADKLARDRAVLEAQFKAKKELMNLDKEAEMNAAKTPAEKEAIQKKYAGKEAALESGKESADLNLVNTTVGKLNEDIKTMSDKKGELEAEQISWSHTITSQRNLGLPTDHASQMLGETTDKLKDVDAKIIAAQEKVTKYSGEADTAGAVHGINDTARSAAENRTISKSVMEGVDPAMHGAKLTDEQRNANAAMAELFGHYNGGIKDMQAIIRYHMQHSTSLQSEMTALKNALAELQRRQNEGHR